MPARVRHQPSAARNGLSTVSVPDPGDEPSTPPIAIHGQRSKTEPARVRNPSLRRSSTQDIGDMHLHFGRLELATLHRNARPAPFLRTLGLVGSALHNRAVYAFFNVFAIVGALACGLVGGGHTNVIFWYFSASTPFDRKAVIAVFLSFRASGSCSSFLSLFCTRCGK